MRWAGVVGLVGLAGCAERDPFAGAADPATASPWTIHAPMGGGADVPVAWAWVADGAAHRVVWVASPVEEGVIAWRRWVWRGTPARWWLDEDGPHCVPEGEAETPPRRWPPAPGWFAADVSARCAPRRRALVASPGVLRWRVEDAGGVASGEEGLRDGPAAWFQQPTWPPGLTAVVVGDALLPVAEPAPRWAEGAALPDLTRWTPGRVALAPGGWGHGAEVQGAPDIDPRTVRRLVVALDGATLTRERPLWAELPPEGRAVADAAAAGVPPAEGPAIDGLRSEGHVPAVGPWRARVEAAMRLVAERVTAAPVAGPPRAAATWARGRGDCDDQAALLAALLRGAGVPARRVSGLLWVRGPAGAQWVGHAWVEVDGWGAAPVAVDPALGQVLADAARVPFPAGARAMPHVVDAR